MKYYYNGELVRTSKNHIYTHAVIDITNNSLKGCRSSKDNAEAIISSEISHYEQKIRNYESALKALENGKSGYYAKEGRRTYYNRFDPARTAEEYRKWIEWNKEYISRVKNNWKVVELERR